MSTSFDDIADILLALGTAISPAELHGQLVGQLCLGLFPNKEQWLLQVSDLSRARVEVGSRYGDELIDWSHEVYGELVDEDFAFELLLPDEDQSLEERMEEVAAWSKAFTAGVSIATSLNGGAQLPPDTDDFYQDIIAVSQLDPEGEIDDTPESDLDQIIEYIRVGVIQLALESKEAAEADADDSKVH